MKLRIPIRDTRYVYVDAIRVCVVVPDEADMPNNYPHWDGDTWDVTIDIETGQIRDWPQGVEPLELYMKVVDSGSYYLLSGKEVVATIENNYVPDCIPGEDGDYIDFKIDAAGKITNWSFDGDEAIEDFFPNKK